MISKHLLRQYGRASFASAQRGNTYMEFGILAVIILVTGALLASVHPLFTWLMPIGVVVFFTPNILALWHWGRAEARFRTALTRIRKESPGSLLVLKNELWGSNARAIWLDAPSRLGYVAGDEESSVRPLDTLVAVRAVHSEKTHAHSFHRGDVTIPARYCLVFEFAQESKWELVTLKRRVMDNWIAMLQPQIEGRLNVLALS